jgi:hypothetical protein
MVILTQHGNIDPATLPRYKDAENVTEFPHSLSYTSAAADVATVADFTREAMAAEGWQEYGQPFAAGADDPDRQQLEFKKNGVRISTYITVAPAQNNKTSVQYTPLLLNYDLPTLADATNLELDDSRPYLSYKTASDFEAVLDFYRTEMTALDWEQIEEVGLESEEKAIIAFTHNDLPLLLELSHNDNQTAVILRTPEAGELAALTGVETPPTSPASTSSSDEAPAAETLLNPHNIPLPPDAAGAGYDADYEEISFNTQWDVEALVEFYRTELPTQGWSEDETFSMVEQDFASLDFEQGEASLTITILPDPLGSGTQVDIQTYGLAWGEGGTEEPEIAEASTTPTPDAPAYTIKDWPVPDDAEEVTLEGDDLKYVIAWDLQQVANYYRPTMAEMGLSDSCFEMLDEADLSSLSCSSSSGMLNLNLFMYQGPEDKTEVEINFVNYALAEATEPPPASDSDDGSSELTLTVNEDDIPLPSDQSGYSSEGTKFRRVVSVASPSDLAALQELYQAELPALGWRPVKDEETLPDDDVVTLAFVGDEGSLTVELKEAGTGTEILITTKNPTAAQEAGVLPPAGKARLILGNINEETVTVTLDGKAYQVEPEAGMGDTLEGLTMVDLAPGTYTVEVEIPGAGEFSEEVELKADEAWGVMAGPGGLLPLQFY